MAPLPPTTALHRHAVAHAVGLLLIGGALAQAVQPVQAQQSAPAAARAFDIPPGPLSGALNRYASAAGVALTFSAAQTDGRQSPGVTGRHTVAEGFARVLAGSGLQAQETGPGRFALVQMPRPAAAAEGATLAAVTVTATAERGATTEGTGAYVSAAPLTTATPLGLTLRETPQSVSVITSQRMEDQGLASILQTLVQVPGVAFSTIGTELGEVKARGYNFNNYQIDGVSSFAEATGAGIVPPQQMADMALYDRMEVLRGASGLITGAGDPSGAINMVRKKPTAEFQGAVEAGASSWNDKRAVLDLSGPLNEARSVRGRLIAVGQDGDSHIDHYGRNKGQIYGVLEADLTRSARLTAGLEHERKKIQGESVHGQFPLWFSDGTRTDLPTSFTSASRDNRLDIRTTKAFATLEQALGTGWKLSEAEHRFREHRWRWHPAQRREARYGHRTNQHGRAPTRPLHAVEAPARTGPGRHVRNLRLPPGYVRGYQRPAQQWGQHLRLGPDRNRRVWNERDL